MKLHPTLRSVFAAMLLAVASHPLASCAPNEPHAEAPLYTNASAQAVSDDISTSRQNGITRAVKACSPAIVGINVTEVREQYYRDPYSFFDDPFFQRFRQPRTYKRQYEVQGLGSGFIISKDGYIITNDHVAGNASKIVITMTDGKKYDAKIIGTDATTDVALLKIEGDNFPYLKLSNSDDVQVGEWAIAFGNPFGLFNINAKPTVTVGVVSNTDVDFTQPDEQGTERVYKGMLQTDAAISSGNSGGPLVNALGEVIGVNTVIYSTAQSSRGAGSIGIGFSIPINRVKRVVDKLRNDGAIDRDFWTGMQVETMTPQIGREYALAYADGAFVLGTQRKSPAEEAGIEPGDIITHVDGRTITSAEDLNLAILDGTTNQKMDIRVMRGGKSVSLSMTLKKRPRNTGVRN